MGDRRGQRFDSLGSPAQNRDSILDGFRVTESLRHAILRAEDRLHEGHVPLVPRARQVTP